MNLIERLQYDWARGKMVQRLIMVNVAVFFVVNILFGILGLWNINVESPVSRWFALTPDLSKFITAPWTIFTYGFLHDGFFHILFNMLWLYWIGNVLEEFIGSRKILPVYIYGVVAGGLLMMLFHNLFDKLPINVYMVGASAGVMAIIWATVALLPEYKINLLFIGPIPLLYIAALMTGFDLIRISGDNSGGHIAHIGGALMGYWFIKLYQKGTDLSIGFNHSLDAIINMFSTSKKPKMKVVRGEKSKNINTNPKSENFSNNQERLDAILDKINKTGYSSLSKQEKEFLKKQSQN